MERDDESAGQRATFEVILIILLDNAETRNDNRQACIGVVVEYRRPVV